MIVSKIRVLYDYFQLLVSRVVTSSYVFFRKSFVVFSYDLALRYPPLHNKIEQFDRRLNAVDKAQSAVEREIDVELPEADIDEAADFRNIVREARVQAATRLVRTSFPMMTIISSIMMMTSCLVDPVGAEVANQSNSGLQHSSTLGVWIFRAG